MHGEYDISLDAIVVIEGVLGPLKQWTEPEDAKWHEEWDHLLIRSELNQLEVEHAEHRGLKDDEHREVEINPELALFLALGCREHGQLSCISRKTCHKGDVEDDDQQL